MFDMNSFGRLLILFGAVLIAIGIIFTLGGKFSWFGRLPGDIYIQKKNFTFFFPVVTSLLVSVILSIIMIFLRRR